MLTNSDFARLEFSLQIIEDIFMIIERHKSIENALTDKEGYHAIMMCLMQIGESLSKLINKNIANILPIDLAYKMRNIIVHEYIGINVKVIRDTILNDIPQLKSNIIELLNKYKKN